MDPIKGLRNLRFSRVLFRNEDGSPMFFSPMNADGDHPDLEYLITHGGGLLVDKDKDGDSPHVLGLCHDKDKSLIQDKGCLPLTFIRKCILRNKFLNPEDFRRQFLGLAVTTQTTVPEIDPDFDIPHPRPVLIRASGLSQSRMRYSTEEDVSIITYLCKNSVQGQVKGRALWERMEREQVTAHTSQSMKARFIKKILPHIKNYRIPEKWKKSFGPKRPWEYVESESSHVESEDEVVMEVCMEDEEEDQPSTSRQCLKSSTSKQMKIEAMLPIAGGAVSQCFVTSSTKSSTSSGCRSTDPKDNASSTNQNLRSSKTRSIDPNRSVASRSNRSPKSFKTKSIDRVNNVASSTNETPSCSYTRSVDTMSDIQPSASQGLRSSKTGFIDRVKGVRPSTSQAQGSSKSTHQKRIRKSTVIKSFPLHASAAIKSFVQFNASPLKLARLAASTDSDKVKTSQAEEPPVQIKEEILITDCKVELTRVRTPQQILGGPIIQCDNASSLGPERSKEVTCDTESVGIDSDRQSVQSVEVFCSVGDNDSIDGDIGQDNSIDGDIGQDNSIDGDIGQDNSIDGDIGQDNSIDGDIGQDNSIDGDIGQDNSIDGDIGQDNSIDGDIGQDNSIDGDIGQDNSIDGDIGQDNSIDGDIGQDAGYDGKEELSPVISDQGKDFEEPEDERMRPWDPDMPSTSKQACEDDFVSKETTRKRIKAVMAQYLMSMDEAIQKMIQEQDRLWKIVD